MPNKSVLMVAYYFPPIAASGSMRSLGFCRYLGDYGWSARVLTTDQKSVFPPTDSDETLRRRVPKDLPVESVPYSNPEQAVLRLRNRLRQAAENFLGSEKAREPAMATPEAIPERRSFFSRRFASLKDAILERMFAFPDPQCFWLRPAVRQLTRISRSEYPNIVFATGGPWTGLLVGKTLAERFHVPFVVDLRDPWTCNPYLEFSSPRWLEKAKRLERSIYQSAAHIVANTAELRTRLQEDHPDLKDKMTTISNGFDTESYQPGAGGHDGGNQVNAASCRGLELCHFGSVYGARNPRMFLRAVKNLVDERNIGPEQLRLRFVGAWDVTEPACEQLAQELEAKGILRREAPVPYDECLRQMRRAKNLLVIQPGSELQIPAKIFDYIATERPILVIGGEGATSQLLQKHRLGVACPNEASAITELLFQLATGQKRIEPPCKEVLAGFQYRHLAGKLASVLDNVCAEKNR